MASINMIEQAKTFIAKLSTAQKVTIGIAVSAAIAGITLLIFHSTSTQMEVLFSELEQRDAAGIVDKLKEQKIAYELSNGGSTILVPAEIVHETRLSLAKDGMPANSTVGYEIFDKTNLGMSDFVQRLNFKRAIEGELQKTISTFDEIQKVRVMIVIPEKALFDKDQKRSTASVHLHLKSGRSMSKLNIDGIQNLVSSSVEGMAAKDVVVVDQRGQMLSEAKRNESAGAALSATQYEQQQKVDEYMIHKVQSLLDGVLGPNKAIVRVNSELDFTQVEKTKENFDPDGQVVLSEERITEARKSKDSLDYPPVNQESNVGKTRANYLNSKVLEHIVSAVGTVKRVSVSVMVDGTTKVNEVNGEKKLQYTPRSDDEMNKITQIVRNAVGFDPQRNDQVSVVNMPFDQTALEEELKEPASYLNMTPTEITQMVVVIIALIVAVWMVRKVFASPQIRRKIEEIIAPGTLQQLGMSSQYMLGPGGQILANNLTVGPDGQLLGAGSRGNLPLLEQTNALDRDELASRARARLDADSQRELSEDQMVIEEMKHRIQRFFESNEEHAVKLVKSIMNKNPA